MNSWGALMLDQVDGLFDVHDPRDEQSTDARKYTERELLDALHTKLDAEAKGNGGHRWIVAEKVRNIAGYAVRRGELRTADALAIDTWESKGLEIHGFEVKCSRSDWLTELKQPEKSEPFRRFCDRWWLVTSSKDIVKPGELPAGWGHMAIAPTYVERNVGMDVWLPEWRPVSWSRMRYHARVPSMTLRRVVQAPKLSDREPISREMMATIMRSVAITAERKSA